MNKRLCKTDRDWETYKELQSITDDDRQLRFEVISDG